MKTYKVEKEEKSELCFLRVMWAVVTQLKNYHPQSKKMHLTVAKIQLMMCGLMKQRHIDL